MQHTPSDLMDECHDYIEWHDHFTNSGGLMDYTDFYVSFYLCIECSLISLRYLRYPDHLNALSRKNE